MRGEEGGGASQSGAYLGIGYVGDEVGRDVYGMVRLGSRV